MHLGKSTEGATPARGTYEFTARPGSHLTYTPSHSAFLHLPFQKVPPPPHVPATGIPKLNTIGQPAEQTLSPDTWAGNPGAEQGLDFHGDSQ